MVLLCIANQYIVSMHLPAFNLYVSRITLCASLVTCFFCSVLRFESHPHGSCSFSVSVALHTPLCDYPAMDS